MLSRVFVVLLSAVSTALPQAGLSQGADIPSTPAGRQAAALLDAIRHASDERVVRDFFAEHVAPEFRDAFPMSAHISQFQRLLTDLGEFTLGDVRSRGEQALMLELKSGDGASLFELSVEVEPSAPHRILAIGITTGAAGPPRRREERTAATPTSDVLVSRLRTLVDSLYRADQFSGAVLLAQGATTLFQEAYGMAARELSLPNAVGTRMNLGSINKIFTAVAIHQLAEQAAVKLDAALGEYLPDYANAEARRLVTIRQLLEHRSGITGDIFRAAPGKSVDSLHSISDFLGLVAGNPLQFTPGEREEYSNAGYVVLGAVIERVSGLTYYEYVSQHIFEPLGMRQTGSYPKDSLPPNTAIGYTRRPGPGGTSGSLRPNTPYLPGRGSSAGGGYSTAEDLLRFAIAVQRGDLAGVAAGLGIAGGAPGINALLEVGLAGGYHLIVLANMDPPAAERVGERFLEWVGR